jgi:hypothetical protein
VKVPSRLLCQKRILTVIGDVDIFVTVIVVVTDGDAHAIVGVARLHQTRCPGYIGEGTVCLLAI